MDIALSPTIGRAVESDATVVLLFGPRREGKTTGGYVKHLVEAAKLPRETLPLRVLVVRDTFVNLERTTLATLKELGAQGLDVRLVNRGREALVGRGLCHFFFVGLDRLEQLNALQGFGAGVLWLEEPAPAADLSGGIAAEVFGVGMTSLSQPGVRHYCLITMNPPDEDHWTLAVTQQLEAFKRQSPDLPVTVATFYIPKGDNRHIPATVRTRNEAALRAIGRADLVARLVEGRVGQIVVGEPVTPEFHDRYHVAPAALPILRDLPLIRGWDFGLHPTCHLSQVTPLRRWHSLATLQGPNIGLEQFLNLYYRPWAERYLGTASGTGWTFRDIGDPSGAMREQSNSERSAVRVLQEQLGATFEPGPVEWPARRDALKGALAHTGLVQVDPEDRLLIRALRGGAHYPKDGLGRIVATVEAYKRASGIYSHALDAMSYVAARLFPVGASPRRPQAKPTRPPAPAGLGWMTV